MSAFELEPLYQANFPIHSPKGTAPGCGNPDVAYNADPDSGFAVYATGYTGWLQVGGTSAGAPQWAALIAIARSMGWSPLRSSAIAGTDTAIYSAASKAVSYHANFHDVTGSTNGTCGQLCTAGTGYDFVTGIGSPQANNLVINLVAR